MLALELTLILLSPLREVLPHVLSLGEALALALWKLLWLGRAVPLILSLNERVALELELEKGLGLPVSLMLREPPSETVVVADEQTEAVSG